jgi:hypothetical protein
MLGSGAFGCVHKVRCLQSTKISNDGNERVLLSKKSIRDTKSEIMRANQNHKSVVNKGRQLLADSFYVIKEIDVGNVPE